MTGDELKKLKGHYFGLLGQKQLFDTFASKAYYIDPSPVGVLQDTFDSVEKDFPGLLRTFSCKNFYASMGGAERYNVPGIQAFLASAVGKLKAEIDSQESVTIFEKRDFSYVNDSEIRKILERDYLEIQRALVSSCWKSVIILSGGVIEAILLDLLQKNLAKAKASSKAPASNPDITKWDLADLINVSVDLGLVSGGVEKLSNSVREYRNLIHPGNEIRKKLKFDAEEARIAFEVLGIVCRDLS
jgi:hypothetical protein